MSHYDADSRLRTSRSGRRFENAQTESLFRDWEHGRITDRVRIMSLISGTCWIILPGLGGFYHPQLFGSQELLVCYGLALPIHFLGLPPMQQKILDWFGPKGGLLLVSCALVGVSSLITIYLGWYRWNVPITTMVSGAILAQWTLFLRMPTSYSIVSGSALIVPGMIGVLIGYLQGDFNLAIVWSVVSMGVASIFIIAVTSMASDRSARREYAALEALAEQRRELEVGHNLIRRYIPQAVVQQIMSGAPESVEKPMRRRVTILFADIAGFTSAADRLEPEVVAEILGEFLSAMSQEIDINGGTLNEVAGDGVMALFGAPEEAAPEEQARRALKVARSIMRRLSELNESWRRLGLDEELEMRIGINTGVASVGSYGSEGRMTYTAIGTQTNIAARIEAAAEPGEILVSYATNELLGESERLAFRQALEVKGVHFPVKVFGDWCGDAQQIAAADV